jgi:hypothetical protein
MVRVEPEENTSENGQGRTRIRKCILKWSGWNQKKMHLKMARVEPEKESAS